MEPLIQNKTRNRLQYKFLTTCTCTLQCKTICLNHMNGYLPTGQAINTIATVTMRSNDFFSKTVRISIDPNEHVCTNSSPRKKTYIWCIRPTQLNVMPVYSLIINPFISWSLSGLLALAIHFWRWNIMLVYSLIINPFIGWNLSSLLARAIHISRWTFTWRLTGCRSQHTPIPTHRHWAHNHLAPIVS